MNKMVRCVIYLGTDEIFERITQIFTIELTTLRLIHSVLIRQKYYTTRFHFENKLLIEQKI